MKSRKINCTYIKNTRSKSRSTVTEAQNYLLRLDLLDFSATFYLHHTFAKSKNGEVVEVLNYKNVTFKI